MPSLLDTRAKTACQQQAAANLFSRSSPESIAADSTGSKSKSCHPDRTQLATFQQKSNKKLSYRLETGRQQCISL